MREQVSTEEGAPRRCDRIGPGGIDPSIRPGTPGPDTVLAVAMSSRSSLLAGYPQGEPSAFVTAGDAGLLRQALAAAFGSEQPAGDASTVPGGLLRETARSS